MKIVRVSVRVTVIELISHQVYCSFYFRASLYNSATFAKLSFPILFSTEFAFKFGKSESVQQSSTITRIQNDV